MGTVLITIMDASIAGIKASSSATDLAQIETVLQNAADRVNRAPLKCDYGHYVSAAAQAAHGDPTQSSYCDVQVVSPGVDATASGTWIHPLSPTVQYPRCCWKRCPTGEDHNHQPKWKGDSFDAGGQEQCLSSPRKQHRDSGMTLPELLISVGPHRDPHRLAGDVDHRPLQAGRQHEWSHQQRSLRAERQHLDAADLSSAETVDRPSMPYAPG